MRIPITMCHGVNTKREPPLDTEHFANCFRIASEMGFESISYDQLAAWKGGESEVPQRPIMFDFDHPAKSIRHEIHPIMQEHGFEGNLFINTGAVEGMYSKPMPDFETREWMTWGEIGELMDAGWHIGSHTHTHPNLSDLSMKDPSGEAVREELVKCDEILERQLGVRSRDFAFTGTTWSAVAESEVQRRYRFGRLWIIGSTYQADGGEIRYADLVGVCGPDESDGGPPCAARYITEQTHPYRLPSMELEYLIYGYDAFRSYLLGSSES